MNRPLRVILLAMAAAVLAITASACGTQRISIPKSDPNYAQDNYAAHLFAQRCAGCHTLSYAGTHGSAANPRTAQAINGPNFDQRCERPVTRVLYAIENGGFSGAYMPQNIFVGQQARDVAEFVSRFAGRDAPIEPDVTPCDQQAIGTLPALPTGTVSPGKVSPSSGNGALSKKTPTAKTHKGKAQGTNVVHNRASGKKSKKK